MTRHLGINLPLSSMPSSSSWGIGEIGDLDQFAPWLEAAGCDRLMLLPIGTMPTGQTSPYSACSAMAIDPIYVSVPAMDDFQRIGGMAGLGEDNRRLITAVRESPRLRIADVRRVKEAAIGLAFERFMRDEWTDRTARAAAFAGFTSREKWWLDDYALFRACETMWPGRTWREWPEEVARRDERALGELRRQLSHEIKYTQYVQWIADDQWRTARRALLARGIALYGDVPFMVDTHSADVWARQHEFLTDVSVGVPPDAFSDTGQDWGLPMYRWDVIAASEFAWIHQRARRMAALYDGFRVDHLVGFYRTYGRGPNGDTFFLPDNQAAQLWQGEQVMRAFLHAGAAVVAEDLGTVPDFVRASIARLGIGGYKVLRWERVWHEPGQPFLLPSHYPRRSVATTGTHDTEPLAIWWEQGDIEERVAVVELMAREGLGRWDPTAPWSGELRDALLRTVMKAASDQVFLPIQDVFGWRDRINTPATVGDHNWTWRLPWPVDAWPTISETQERAVFLASGRP
ncbi:MAG: 4-alpha-glucanotransferase [Acidobacteria bacterium]|nr:4-alpha-glucanotransferase [Acidobacteriota bacterium]